MNDSIQILRHGSAFLRPDLYVVRCLILPKIPLADLARAINHRLRSEFPRMDEGYVRYHAFQAGQNIRVYAYQISPKVLPEDLSQLAILYPIFPEHLPNQFKGSISFSFVYDDYCFTAHYQDSWLEDCTLSTGDNGIPELSPALKVSRYWIGQQVMNVTSGKSQIVLIILACAALLGAMVYASQHYIAIKANYKIVDTWFNDLQKNAVLTKPVPATTNPDTNLADSRYAEILAGLASIRNQNTSFSSIVINQDSLTLRGKTDNPLALLQRIQGKIGFLNAELKEVRALETNQGQFSFLIEGRY